MLDHYSVELKAVQTTSAALTKKVELKALSLAQQTAGMMVMMMDCLSAVSLAKMSAEM